MAWAGTSSQTMSLTTWTVLYFTAASWQASTTSLQVDSCPVNTTHPSDRAARTAPLKRLDSRLFVFRRSMARLPFTQMVSRSTDLLCLSKL